MSSLSDYKNQVRSVKLEDLRPIDSTLSKAMHDAGIKQPKTVYELRLTSHDENQASDIGSIMPSALDHPEFKEMISDLEEWMSNSKEKLNVSELFADYKHGRVYVY